MSARPVLGRGLELKIMMRKRSERWHPSVSATAGGSLSGLGGPGTMVLPDSELFTLSSVGEQQEHQQGES